jgi:hypothetical protein
MLQYLAFGMSTESLSFGDKKWTGSKNWPRLESLHRLLAAERFVAGLCLAPARQALKGVCNAGFESAAL